MFSNQMKNNSNTQDMAQETKTNLSGDAGLQNEATTGGRIHVALRIRPLNDKEKAQKGSLALHVDGNTVVLKARKTGLSRRSALISSANQQQSQQSFTFDQVYNDCPEIGNVSNTLDSQSAIFEDHGKYIVENALQGFNLSMLAYGQTGAGKTHSMMGSSDIVGVIPRICRYLIQRVGTPEPNTRHHVQVSFFEIYSEKIRDLLDTTPRLLKIRENPKAGPYVENLSCMAVDNWMQMENWIKTGNQNRTVASTNMNAQSSRAHSIFTISVITIKSDEILQKDYAMLSKIHLVDLSGSERSKQTGATGQRLKEATEINKSLATLGRVISALSTKFDSSKSKPYFNGSNALQSSSSAFRMPDKARSQSSTEEFVPFRDSVLTWLLKESLGGNCKTTMIACISPTESNFDETLSTLRYAARTKKITNVAVVNEDAAAIELKRLRCELDEMRQRLSDAEMYQAELARLRKQLAPLPEVEDIQLINRVSNSKDDTQCETQPVDMPLTAFSTAPSSSFMPFPLLVNLSEQRHSNESAVYTIASGCTLIGRKRGGRKKDGIPYILLHGSDVNDRHCLLTNKDGAISIEPIDRSYVLLNGNRIDGISLLCSNDRISIGQHHSFLCTMPTAANTAEDWSSAEEDIYSDDDRKSGYNANANTSEVSKVDADLESKISFPAEHDLDDRSLAGNLAHCDSASMSYGIVENNVPSPYQNPELASKFKQLHVNQLFLSKDELENLVSSVLNDASHANKINPYAVDYLLGPCALSLAADVAFRWRWKTLRSMISDEVMSVVFMIDEANALCAALNRPDRYFSELAFLFEGFGASPLQQIRRLQQVYVQIACWNWNSPGMQMRVFEQEAFADHLYFLRDLYGDFLHKYDSATQEKQLNEHILADDKPSLAAGSFHVSHSQLALFDVNNSVIGSTSDAFLIGVATLFLEPLRYGQPAECRVAVVDRRAVVVGHLKVSAVAFAVTDTIHSQSLLHSEADYEAEDGGVSMQYSDDDEFPPKRGLVRTQHSQDAIMAVQISIFEYTAAIGPNKDAYINVEYHFHDEKTIFSTDVMPSTNLRSFKLNHCHLHLISKNYTSSLLDYFQLDAIRFQVWLRSPGEYQEAGAQLFQEHLPVPMQHSLDAFTGPHTIDHDDDDNDDDNAIDSTSTSTLSSHVESELNFRMHIRSPSTHRFSGADSCLSGPVAVSHTVLKSTTENAFYKTVPRLKGALQSPMSEVSRRSFNSISRRTSAAQAVANEETNSDGVDRRYRDQLLYMSVDVEELDGVNWVPATIKAEPTSLQRPVLRLTAAKQRRFVISILQYDESPFILESCAFVRVHAISKLLNRGQRTLHGSCQQWLFDIQDQFSHTDHKLLVVTAAWPSALFGHEWFLKPSDNGERVCLQISLGLYILKTTVRAILSPTINLKIYKDSFSFFSLGSQMHVADRLPMIGYNYILSRRSSPQTIEKIFKSHAVILNRMQRHLRLEQVSQHMLLIERLRESNVGHVAEAEQRFLATFDSHIRLQLPEGRLNNATALSGITINVAEIQFAVGIKCGFLHLQNRSDAFKRKWFVLRPPYLWYYADRREKHQGVIHLFQGKAWADDSREGVFIIDTLMRHCVLQASSNSEREDWLRLLQKIATRLTDFIISSIDTYNLAASNV